MGFQFLFTTVSETTVVVTDAALQLLRKSFL